GTVVEHRRCKPIEIRLELLAAEGRGRGPVEQAKVVVGEALRQSEGEAIGAGIGEVDVLDRPLAAGLGALAKERILRIERAAAGRAARRAELLGLAQAGVDRVA